MAQLLLFKNPAPGRPKNQAPKSGKQRQAEKRKRDAQKGYVEISLKVKISTKKKLALLAKKQTKTRGEIIDQLIQQQGIDKDSSRDS